MKEQTTTTARDFAARAHGDQKYGDHPYTFHLDAVVDLLRIAGFDSDEQLAVGYLHDVVEDTPETGKTLAAAGFSGDVVNGVIFCTDLEGPNRKTRKALTYKKMGELRDQYAKDASGLGYVLLGMRAKLADRLANMAQAMSDGNVGLHDMYWKEKDSFRDALYLVGVADGLWAEYDKLLAERPRKPRRRG